MRLFQPTALLCRELVRVVPERPFSIEFWDGGRVPATEPRAPTFFVRRASALAHALRAPGPLGLGRAYVEGSLETDDIDAAFVVVDDWEPPPIPPRDRARADRELAARARSPTGAGRRTWVRPARSRARARRPRTRSRTGARGARARPRDTAALSVERAAPSRSLWPEPRRARERAPRPRPQSTTKVPPRGSHRRGLGHQEASPDDNRDGTRVRARSGRLRTPPPVGGGGFCRRP